jgi:hypothetical protein
MAVIATVGRRLGVYASRKESSNPFLSDEVKGPDRRGYATLMALEADTKYLDYVDSSESMKAWTVRYPQRPRES